MPVLIVIAGYVALCVFVLYLMGWVLAVALPLALVCGIVLAFVVMVRTLLDAEPRAELITAEHVVVGAAGLPPQRKSAPFGRDRAWPGYLVGQWRRDFSMAVQGGRTVLNWSWRGIQRLIDALPQPGLWWAVLLAPILCWLAFSAGAFLGAALIVIVGGAALLAGWIGWGLVIGVLRGCDLVVRRRRGAKATCPACYYVTLLPSFPCDECGNVHRDLRPGLLGAIWRRCGCGRTVPTTVLRATHQLSPLCPRCDQPLREGSAVRTDILLPVLGPVSAGKTRLVHAGLVALRERAEDAGAEFDFVDDDSERTVQDGTRVITTGASTSKTPAGQLPTPITVRITKARRKALVHLFDAAGEFYLSREDNSELEFLDHAPGLILVVDPFSLRWVRDHLSGALESRITESHHASDDPEEVYHLTVRRLQDYGVNTRRRRIVIAVVKVDLLRDLPIASALLSGRVREWLVEAGMDNLVLAAQRDFAEVRYFPVSSTSDAHDGLSPGAPFSWLISRGGFPLPEQATAQERA